MKTSTICAFVFAVMCLFALPQQAQAQYAYGISAIGYDDTTKEVFGYSATELDYYAGYYYDPYVEGFMYDQYNYYPIDSGYDRGYAYYWPAEVGTYRWPAQPNTEYDVFSDHYVIAAWSTSVRICDDYYSSGCWADYWYDAWGYGFLGGGNYGAPWWWWGNWYGGYVPERTYYLGTTGVYIITPEPEPSCNLTMQLRSVSPRRPETGDLSGQTRPAMLGAQTRFTADVTVNGSPVAPNNGTWEWSAGDTFRRAQPLDDPSKLFVYWNTEGTKTVYVTYTAGNGCKITKSMNVNVTVPTVTQYTADMVPERLTNNNANCSEISGRDLFTLGCAHPDTATTEPGITLRATAKIPDDSISDPADSKIKFVQIVNLYRRRTTASRGTECMTFRSSRNDLNSPSAWRVDTQDPYQSEFEPTRSGVPSKGTIAFGENLTASIETRDSPGQSLSVPGQLFELEVDEHFEMLVQYFTGSSNPQSSTPGTTQIIGTLAWNWGGRVTYLPASDSYTYTVLHPAGAHFNGVSTRQVRGFVNVPYNPLTDPNAWHTCPDGGGGPTPTPTPTPFPTPTPPGGCSGDNSEFVSQSVPTTMDAGVNYNVSVTMKNPCGSTWTSDLYKLGSQNPQDNLTWGTNRVYLPPGTNVGPGNTFTFNYTVTAPSSPGFYNFQWRMVHEGVQWFGEFTPNVVVNVVGSGCDAFAEQDCYYNGGDWFDTSTCTCHYPPPCLKQCDWQPY